MSDLFDLSGRVALMTGGYRGVGRMIAAEFVERGVRTYITGRNAERVKQSGSESAQLLSLSVFAHPPWVVRKTRVDAPGC